MHFQIIEKKKPSRPGLWWGIWLVALMGALLSMVDGLAYFYAVLPGVAMVIAAGFLPRKWRRITGAIGLALCLAWLCLRHRYIADGLACLANQLFTLSEEGQNFTYTHFHVVRNAPQESLVFVSCVFAALGLLVGNSIYLALTLLVAIMIAYFGVAPSIVWLSILVFAAFANGLPKKDRWLPAILIAVLVAAIAFSVQKLAPEPNVQIDNIAENLWEMFMPPAPEDPEIIATEPSEAPEIPDIEDILETMETIELPEGLEMPTKNPAVPQMQKPEPSLVPVGPGEKPVKESKKVPVGPILSAILAVAAVVAVWLLIVAQKRKGNRQAMYAQNNAEAIREMYFYAKRWRKWNAFADEIPPQVEDIWLEAAYSEHEMLDSQRETMRAFVRESAQKAWNNLNWWERFVVYFCHAL